MEGEREERGDACGGSADMRRDGGGVEWTAAEEGRGTVRGAWTRNHCKRVELYCGRMIGNECGNVWEEQDEGWGSDKARRRCERQGAAAEISSGDFSERANATHKGVLLACAWQSEVGC